MEISCLVSPTLLCLFVLVFFLIPFTKISEEPALSPGPPRWNCQSLEAADLHPSVPGQTVMDATVSLA